MKKPVLFSLLCALLLNVSATDTPKDIIPFFSFSTFYAPEKGSYVETYLTIPGHTLYFGPSEDGKYFASVEVTIILKKDSSIVDFSKVILKSPSVSDTANVNFSLVDVQRFALPNGDYNIEVKLVDMNSPFEPMYVLENVSLDYDPALASVSGIQLIERYKKTEEVNIFSKAGYELMPLPLNFYPRSINSLTFYCEVYNTGAKLGADEPMLIKAFFEQYETKKIVSDFQTFKRDKAKSVISYMHEFNITSLPSGNYFLVVEVRDKNNELVGSNRLFFQRSNPPADSDYLTMTMPSAGSFVHTMTSNDTLYEYIQCLRPIATENEKYFIDRQAKTADIERLQQFFYTFWAGRSENPQGSWNSYYLEVQKVQKSFGTKIKKGYQSDRGRVYLQYGPPNTMTQQANEPSTYPYEIWHYYTLNNQRNRKFVFYNRDLITNDYELLHSDAFGEIQDLQWQLKLNQRNFATNDPDLQRSDWGWGNRVDDYWRNPR